jgi:hypothetical protein
MNIHTTITSTYTTKQYNSIKAGVRLFVYGDVFGLIINEQLRIRLMKGLALVKVLILNWCLLGK